MNINLINNSINTAELKDFIKSSQHGLDTKIGEFGARFQADRDKELV